MSWENQVIYVSPFALINRILKKIEDDKNKINYHNPILNNTSLVFAPGKVVNQASLFIASDKENSHFTNRRNGCTPTNYQDEDVSLLIIMDSIRTKGIPEGPANIILQSWREGTRKQYSVYLFRWIQYCTERNIDPLTANQRGALEFLTSLFNQGIGCSALSTAH